MAEYRWYVGDLRTGKISRTVDLDATWTMSFDYGTNASLEASFPLKAQNPQTGDPEWPTARADTTASKQFLVVSYVDDSDNETFLDGGPIWPRSYDDATSELKFGASGLPSYFDRRKPITAVFGDPPASDLGTIAFGLRDGTLANVAAYLVKLASINDTDQILPVNADAWADLGTLAIDSPPTPDTVDYDLIIRWYELAWTGALLKQLTERADGPEIQFVPRRRTDDPRFLEWEMRIGDPILAQEGPPWVFDRTVPGSHVRDIDIAEDGTGIAQRMWGAGEGEAEGRPVTYQDNPALFDLGFPLLEGEVQSTDAAESSNTLSELIAGDLERASRPREQWTIKVSRDGRPNVGQYRPGDWAAIPVRNHHYLPDGDYSMRILAISGSSGSDEVTITAVERAGQF